MFSPGDHWAQEKFDQNVQRYVVVSEVEWTSGMKLRQPLCYSCVVVAVCTSEDSLKECGKLSMLYLGPVGACKMNH